MKLSSRLFAVALTALAFAATGVSAAPETLKVDASHTTVGFTVRHFFAKVPGRFGDFSGDVKYDAKNVTASSVDVTIQATSIDTKNERRDNHLRSADFFEVEKF